MRCEELAEVVSTTDDGVVVDDWRGRRHVETCLRCQAELVRYRKLVAHLRTLRTDLLDPGAPAGTRGRRARLPGGGRGAPCPAALSAERPPGGLRRGSGGGHRRGGRCVRHRLPVTRSPGSPRRLIVPPADPRLRPLPEAAFHERSAQFGGAPQRRQARPGGAGALTAILDRDPAEGSAQFGRARSPKPAVGGSSPSDDDPRRPLVGDMAMNREDQAHAATAGPTGPRRRTGTGQAEADESPRPRPNKERTSPKQYLHEVRTELRKVAWPSRAEVVRYSVIDRPGDAGDPDHVHLRPRLPVRPERLLPLRRMSMVTPTHPTPATTRARRP